MRRFYRLDVQPDLFGGVLLLKEWGRIGTQGRSVGERFDGEAPALAALQNHAERKRRRGYSAEEKPALWGSKKGLQKCATFGTLIP
jgi:predicted DNA-binding WGR domain protein